MGSRGRGKAWPRGGRSSGSEPRPPLRLRSRGSRWGPGVCSRAAERVRTRRPTHECTHARTRGRHGAAAHVERTNKGMATCALLCLDSRDARTQTTHTHTQSDACAIGMCCTLDLALHGLCPLSSVQWTAINLEQNWATPAQGTGPSPGTEVTWPHAAASLRPSLRPSPPQVDPERGPAQEAHCSGVERGGPQS